MRVFWLIGLFLCWIVLPLTVVAHGGGEIVTGRAPAGPFQVTVWFNPQPPQAGETLHVTIGVISAEETAVLDALVQVRVVASATGQSIINTMATTEQSANKLFYETDFVIDESGEYEMSIAVDQDGLGGEIILETAVVPQSQSRWLWLLGFLAAVGATIWWRRQTAAS